MKSLLERTTCIKGHILSVVGILVITRRDGREERWCKGCQSERSKQRHARLMQTNPEYAKLRRQQSTDWRHDNPNKRREHNKKWYKGRSEEIKLKERERKRRHYRQKLRDDESYKEKARKKTREWAKNNKARKLESDNLSVHKRRARIYGSGNGSITTAEVEALLKQQSSKCANLACRVTIGYQQVARNGHIVVKKLHRDHIVPLVRGGVNLIKNIQLLCANCNHRKATMPQEEFAARNGVLF